MRAGIPPEFSAHLFQAEPSNAASLAKGRSLWRRRLRTRPSRAAIQQPPRPGSLSATHDGAPDAQISNFAPLRRSVSAAMNRKTISLLISQKHVLIQFICNCGIWTWFSLIYYV